MKTFYQCTMFCAIAILTFCAVATTPTITGVTAQQRYPWNGKVDISYTTVTGNIAAAASAVGKPYHALQVTATDRTSGTTHTASAEAITGDKGLSEGRHSIVWDMSADGLTFKSTNVVFRVAVSCASPSDLPATPLYCVVDLSAGANAASYPVTYLHIPPDRGFNSDEYKTTKLVLRLISPGTFMMCGQYEVTLTKPFYCGLFEVTQMQYMLVTGSNPSKYKGRMRPVASVTWNGIRGNSNTYNWPSTANVDPDSFIGRLQSRTGLAFDLPTEAQWEYACRAGSAVACDIGHTEFAEFGEYSLVGRYRANKSDGKGGFGEHTIVGSYKPNAWGIYDTLGNVFEWCCDWYGALQGGAIDPTGPSSGTWRIARGGSWRSDASYCASSNRGYDGEDDNFGFRLVRTLSE